jgi:hypothetical protein
LVVVVVVVDEATGAGSTTGTCSLTSRWLTKHPPREAQTPIVANAKARRLMILLTIASSRAQALYEEASNRSAKAKRSLFADFCAKTQTLRRYLKRPDFWKP